MYNRKGTIVVIYFTIFLKFEGKKSPKISKKKLAKHSSQKINIFKWPS